MLQNMLRYLQTKSLLMILFDKSGISTHNKTPNVTVQAANPHGRNKSNVQLQGMYLDIRSLSISQTAFYAFQNSHTCSLPSSE